MDNCFSKGKTLVIGTTGLIGSRLAALLLKEKRQVIFLDDIKPGQKNLIPQGVEEVVFLAQSADSRNTTMSEDLFFVNTELLVKVIRESVDKGVVRFAYCSTGSVYVPSNSAYNEESPIIYRDISAYIATKLASEILINPWQVFFKRLVIFRPFFNYGPGQDKDRLLPAMFRQVINGEAIYLRNKKGLVFNPLHADDAARFMLDALRLKDGFDIYNVAGDEVVTLFDVVTKIGHLVGRKPCFVYQDGKKDVVLADITKMKSTGFRQCIGIKEGLEDMFQILNQNTKEIKL